MAFDSLLDYSKKTLESMRARGQRSADETLGFVESGPGQVYNEATFRHFLALERKRATRGGRSLLLLLVSSRGEGANARIPAGTAARLFATMTACVREVDFIGWYREEQVIGAVLAQGQTAPANDIQQVIVERVTRTLHEQLSSRVADGLQVRVLHVRGRE